MDVNNTFGSSAILRYTSIIACSICIVRNFLGCLGLTLRINEFRNIFVLIIMNIYFKTIVIFDNFPEVDILHHRKSHEGEISRLGGALLITQYFRHGAQQCHNGKLFFCVRFHIFAVFWFMFFKKKNQLSQVEILWSFT